MEKLSLDAVIIYEGVINAPLHPLHTLIDPVHPVSERVTAADQTLGSHQVPETTPWCDKRGQVSVLLRGQTYGMVAIPVIENGFVRVTWHT